MSACLSTGDPIKTMLARILENRSDRGPNPDYAEDVESLRDLIKKTVRASVEIQGDYHEGGSGSWGKWMLTVLGGLTVLGVVGAIVMYGQLSALREEVRGLHVQVDHVEKIVEPRYRGSD